MVWKAVRRGDLPSEHALTAIEIALGPLDQLKLLEESRGRAVELAIELQHPIYDCFYLALVERERVADKKLIKKAKRLKRVEIRAV